MYKILFLINNLAVGGAEHLTIDLINNVNQKLYKPYLILLNNKVDLLFKLEVTCEVHCFDIEDIVQSVKVFQVLKLVRKIKPDIIHSHLLLADFISGILKLFNPNLRVVSTIHGYYTRRFHKIKIRHKIHFFLQSIFYKRFDKVVCVSKDLAKETSKTFALKEKNIEVIYNGLSSLNKIVRYDLNKRFTGKIVFIGRLVPVKNVQLLITTLRRLPEYYVLTVIGEGMLKEQLKNITEQLDLCNRVKFLGNLTNIEEILIKYDILIIPSFFESFSLIALQGLVCGIPTISSKTGGIREVIGEENSELLFDPLSDDDLFNKILWIEKNFEKIKLNLSKKRSYFAAFSSQKLYDNYQQLYRNLLEQNFVR